MERAATEMRMASLVLMVLLAVAVFGAGCGRRGGEEVAKALAPSPPLPARTVRILCYHGVEENTDNFYFNNTEDFAAQMEVLADEGFQSISCRQLADYLAGKQDIPEKSVLLTIDDGNISVYETAHSIMSRHGFTATLFIYTSAIGNKGHLSWEQVKELQSLGHEIGSHTVTHANLTRLGNGQSVQEHQAHVVTEVTQSKSHIEEVIGEPVVALAYPYGNYDEFVMSAAREAGYRLAFSIDRGAADADSDPFRLPRQMVVKGNSLRTFKRWLAQEPLHLADISPPVGQVVSQAAVEIRARVADDAVSPRELLAEAGKGTSLTVDEQTAEIVISTTLATGANNIRLQYQGSPPRETSWVVVHRP